MADPDAPFGWDAEARTIPLCRRADNVMERAKIAPRCPQSGDHTRPDGKIRWTMVKAAKLPHLQTQTAKMMRMRWHLLKKRGKVVEPLEVLAEEPGAEQ